MTHTPSCERYRLSDGRCCWLLRVVCNHVQVRFDGEEFAELLTRWEWRGLKPVMIGGVA